MKPAQLPTPSWAVAMLDRLSALPDEGRLRQALGASRAESARLRAQRDSLMASLRDTHRKLHDAETAIQERDRVIIEHLMKNPHG